jgi:hypothetical protein
MFERVVEKLGAVNHHPHRGLLQTFPSRVCGTELLRNLVWRLIGDYCGLDPRRAWTAAADWTLTGLDCGCGLDPKGLDCGGILCGGFV